MTSDLKSIRKEFPILQRCIYLNHASTSPLPRRTKKVIDNFLERYVREANIEWADCEAISEGARERIAAFLGAKSEEICFLRNTSEGIITVLNLLQFKSADNVIIAADSFPANFYPFIYCVPEIEKRFIKIMDGDILEQIERKANKKTRLISLDWVHFLSGYQINLKELSEYCRARGIYLLIDAIQGLGALALNLKDIKIDFLVAGAAKWLFPPQGIGILYINEGVLPDLKPNHLGWLSHKWQEFNKIFGKKVLKKSAARYEEGTKNYLGIVGLDENIKMLQEFGMKNVEERILNLTDYLVTELTEMKFEILPRGLGSGIVAFRKRKIPNEYLFELLTKRRFVVSLREDWIRVSPHFYILKEEVAELLNTLKDLAIGA